MVKGVDDREAWFSLAVGFTCNVMMGCCFYAGGVLNVALLKEYQRDTAFTSLIWSVHASLSYFSGPVFSAVTNLSTCRLSLIIGGLGTTIGYFASAFVNRVDILIATYGVISGISITLTSGPPRANVGYRFLRYRGIAAGIVESGNALGIMISGPVVQTLLDFYGLHGTFIMMAGIISQQIVFGMLTFPSASELSAKAERKQQNALLKKGCLVSRIRSFFGLQNINKAFLCVSLSIMTWYLAYIMVLLHLPNLAVIQGHSEKFGALLSLMGGFGSLFGRLLTSTTISQFPPKLLFFGNLGCLAILSFTFPLYLQYKYGMMTFSFFFGLYSGTLITLEIPLALETLGTANISTGLGYMYCAAGLGFIAGPPIAGLIVDQWNSYEYSYYFSGMWLIVSAFIILLSTMLKSPADEEVSTNLHLLERNVEGSERVTKGPNVKMQQSELFPPVARDNDAVTEEKEILLTT